jgi:hypothetical protein
MGSTLSLFRTAAGILKQRPYRTYAFTASVLVFMLYIVVPVLLVPGNTFRIEFELLTPIALTLLILLAAMTGMIIALEVFSFRRSKAARLGAVGEGGAGIVASITGGIIAAASCGCGIGVLLGVFGLGGGALFITKHQAPVILFFLTLVAVSLYYSTRRAAGICAASLPDIS